MSNDSNSNSTIKTTWAGLDEKIHTSKPTWSTGNYATPEPPKDIVKDTPVDTPKDTTKDASYKWLLAHKLSKLVR